MSALDKKNVIFFSPNDDNNKIQKIIDEIFEKMNHNQFGSERYAFLFMPGKYDVILKIGYYTEAIGLGEKKDDVVIKELFIDAKRGEYYNALCNFYRGIINITIDKKAIFAVSQATFMRNCKINTDLYLHHNKSSGSGGFIANCKIKGNIYSGPQQQWLTRNTMFNSFDEFNWNMVFVGCSNASNKKWPEFKFTNIEKTPLIMERPYLIYKDNQFYVVKSKMVKESIDDYQLIDKMIPLNDFYVASDIDDDSIINKKLNEGKNILLTPGIYKLNNPLIITHDDTIILGMGLSTLKATDTNKDALIISNAKRVTIANILFDTLDLKNMLVMNSKNGENDISLLADLFFRIGGVEDVNTNCDVTLLLNESHTICDNFWLWRADHTKGVGWNVNTTKNGIIINGHDNVFYALMVEHFHQYQTIFNGENNRVYMYQSESPYDVERQSDYMSFSNTKNGYSSYKVADHVMNHQAYGIGVYSVFFKCPIDIASAIEAPQNDGIYFKNMIVKELGPYKGVSHVINDLVIENKSKKEKYYIEFTKNSNI